MRRGLTIDSSTQSQDHLLDAAGFDPAIERAEIELFRSDTVERRENATENMIATAIGGCAPQRPKIGDIGDDADRTGIAPLILANAARIGAIEIAAGRTRLDRAGDILQRLDQRQQQRFALLDEKEYGTARRAWPEPRQARQNLDQSIDIADGHADCRNLLLEMQKGERIRTAA